MKSFFSKKVIFNTLIVGYTILFVGCAKDNLIMKTYSPPAQMEKVKDLMANTTSEKSYLDVFINEDIQFILNRKTSNKDVAETLLGNVKKYLTQTNFIGINQNGNSDTISLEIKIVSFQYASTDKSIDASMEVVFSFIKDATDTPIFVEQYKKTTKRSSRSGRQGLPSKIEVLSYMTKNIAADLVMDISPVKGNKLVELKSLPKEISYTIKYAKMKNFKGAIKAMNKYQGEKTLEYYFNLAVYYEAYAAISNDMNFLSKADENYEHAMMMGGSQDDVVIKAKAKFDTFYELIKSIDEQKKLNNKADLNGGDEVL